MTETTAHAGHALGMDLGRRTVVYESRDAILYALAVGTPADRLELVYERDLRVLPTYGLTFGLWACDLLGERGFYDQTRAVHGTQTLEVLAPLPASARFDVTARVAAVWDKGAAAVFEIAVESPYFRATYAIFAPGAGGFGGHRGPSSPAAPEVAPERRTTIATAPGQAALYRLTGDRHAIHVDPEAARAIGQPRPILHGLCTLAVAVRALAELEGAHPAELAAITARFALPVLPGEELEVAVWPSLPGAADRPFTVATERGVVLSGGAVRFATPSPHPSRIP